MKVFRNLLFLSASIIVLYACSESEESSDPGEWTFCECAEMHTDYKGKIATEKDPEEKVKLQEEMAIVEEDCKEFLPGENPTTKEMQAYHKKKANCR